MMELFGFRDRMVWFGCILCVRDYLSGFGWLESHPRNIRLLWTLWISTLANCVISCPISVYPCFATELNLKLSKVWLNGIYGYAFTVLSTHAGIIYQHMYLNIFGINPNHIVSRWTRVLTLIITVASVTDLIETAVTVLLALANWNEETGDVSEFHQLPIIYEFKHQNKSVKSVSFNHY